MTSLSDTDLKLSIVQAVTAIMEDASLWTTPYTVYSEADFEARDRGDPPDRPFVFIMAARREVEPRFLPIILIDMEIMRFVFELGNVARKVITRLHIMARSEGEGERIKSVIMDALVDRDVDFYNFPYTVGNPAVTSQYFEYQWTTEMMPIPPMYMAEGTLRYWSVTTGEIVIP